MAGLFIPDSLPFISEESAARWITGVWENIEKGELDFELILS